MRVVTGRRLWIASMLALGLALAGLFPAFTGVTAQGLGCIPDPDQNRLELGVPNAEGTTQHVDLGDPSVTVGVHFSTAQPGAALLYIGDQWYDLDLYLYARGVCKGAGGWDKLIRAWSVRAERRVLQFMRPNEQIVNLIPGEYLMVAQYHPTDGVVFDASKGFTARVATNPPYCRLDPPDELQPNPAVPSILIARRPDDALYQLGLSIDPPEADRVAFSLMSFGAFLSPPYTDLFDFAWVLDGQPVTLDPGTVVYQIPTEALPTTPGGQHTIQVKAIGARYYPDPLLTHLPPTLAVECAFKTAGASPQSPATPGGPPAPTPGGPPAPATPAPPVPATPPPSGPATPPPPPPPTLGPGSPRFEPDYTLLQRCKDRVGVVGAYSSGQQFDQVVACYVQETVAAGSPLTPAEIEQRIRQALAF